MSEYDPSSAENVDVRLPCITVAATTGGRWVVAKVVGADLRDLAMCLADNWDLVPEESRELLRRLLDDGDSSA